MSKILIICGPSLSGKTYLMYDLIKHYPDKYYKLNQVTTRPKRFDEVDCVDYYFIEPSDYELIKKDLIFRTGFAGNNYGTILDEIYEENKDSKIGIAVVNEEGIEDIKNLQSQGLHKDLDIVIIGLRKSDISFNREGRTEQQIKAEFSVLEKSNITINIDKNKYVNRDLVDKISDVLFEFTKQN